MIADMFAWKNYMKYLECVDNLHKIEVEVDSCWHKGLTSNSGPKWCFAVAMKSKEGRMRERYMAESSYSLEDLDLGTHPDFGFSKWVSWLLVIGR